MLNHQEFTYRTKHYTPCKELVQFVEHLSAAYYEKKDQETLSLVRRAVSEFANDPALKISGNFWSEAHSELLEEPVAKEHVMHEQYQAENLCTQKVFSLVMLSTLKFHFEQMVKITSLPEIDEAKNRHYVTPERETRVQFVSIYHQLQNLVRSLTDCCEISWMMNEEEGKAYINLLPKQLNGALTEARFQILIILYIPLVVYEKE